VVGDAGVTYGFVGSNGIGSVGSGLEEVITHAGMVSTFLATATGTVSHRHSAIDVGESNLSLSGASGCRPSKSDGGIGRLNDGGGRRNHRRTANGGIGNINRGDDSGGSIGNRERGSGSSIRNRNRSNGGGIRNCNRGNGGGIRDRNRGSRGSIRNRDRGNGVGNRSRLGAAATNSSTLGSGGHGGFQTALGTVNLNPTIGFSACVKQGRFHSGSRAAYFGALGSRNGTRGDTLRLHRLRYNALGRRRTKRGWNALRWHRLRYNTPGRRRTKRGWNALRLHRLRYNTLGRRRTKRGWNALRLHRLRNNARRRTKRGWNASHRKSSRASEGFQGQVDLEHDLCFTGITQFQFGVSTQRRC